MHSSRVVNMGGYDPLWYLTIYFGGRCPMEPSLVGAEGSDRESESGSKVGSSICFSLGGPGSAVVYAEGGSLRVYSLSDSSG